MTLRPNIRPTQTGQATIGEPRGSGSQPPAHERSLLGSNDAVSSSGKEALSAATVLLKLEGDLRQIRSLTEFGYFAANETRLVTRSQQTFVFIGSRNGRLQVSAVSAMTTVDRSAPLIASIEGLVAKVATDHGLETIREFNSDSFDRAKSIAMPGYPLRYLAWVPFLNLKGQVIGGVLQARTTPWTEADYIVSRHLANACSYTLLALTSQSPSWMLRGWPLRKSMLLAGCGAIVLGFLPVPMSALAPVEVTPKKAFVVTAPIDGVVDSVLVEPNAVVKTDQPLVRMADTVLKNRLEVAEREVLVAEAKVKKAAQLAFVDLRGRHELGVAQAEQQVRHAERDYARDLLQRSTIKAERDGVAFFTDPKDLVGRPVAVGERLMELADPQRLEFRIDLHVADAIVLNDGARVKVFLDSDPLNPIEARLVRADFQARLRENQQLAFRLIAEREPSETRPLRLGVRGTAQVFSNKVSLAFYLFRRPISAARQWFGF